MVSVFKQTIVPLFYTPEEMVRHVVSYKVYENVEQHHTFLNFSIYFFKSNNSVNALDGCFWSLCSKDKIQQSWIYWCVATNSPFERWG